MNCPINRGSGLFDYILSTFFLIMSITEFQEGRFSSGTGAIIFALNGFALQQVMKRTKISIKYISIMRVIVSFLAISLIIGDYRGKIYG